MTPSNLRHIQSGKYVCIIFELTEYNGERIKLCDILRRKIPEGLVRPRPRHEDIIKTDLKRT